MKRERGEREERDLIYFILFESVILLCYILIIKIKLSVFLLFYYYYCYQIASLTIFSYYYKNIYLKKINEISAVYRGKKCRRNELYLNIKREREEDF